MTDVPPYEELPNDVEQALLSALESLGLPLLSVSTETGMGRIEWLSAGAEALLSDAEAMMGLSTAERSEFERQLLGVATPRDTSHADVPESDTIDRETVLESPKASSLPLRITSTPFDETKTRSLVLLADLRGRRLAEAAYRRAEERFERLVETLASGVWILRSGRIIYANHAGAELLAADRNLLVGVAFTELCEPEDQAVFLENLERVSRGESVSALEYRLRARDQRQLVVEMSTVALEYDGGQAVLAFGRDVTLRKRAEQGQLRADRLSALGLLAGGMAHALNNPLTYVLLNLEHVARYLPSLASDKLAVADVMARLEEAREGAERMATIVKRMRGFARTEESASRVLDVRSVVEAVVELIGHELHHRGKLTMRFDAMPQVMANQSKLEQICLGLLLFAAEMLPDDVSRRPEVRLSLGVDERHFALLEVVCEGCTIEESEIERLLDPFTQSEESRAAGFGLSVCRGLVEQLGGTLIARAFPGNGLLLRTCLPCVPSSRVPESTVPRSSRPSVAPSTVGRGRILLVDDDPGIGKGLRLLLEDEHDVTCFEDPQEALRELLRDSGYDLIFCDLMMPKLSGMDLYQVLRFNRPGYETRMVFMSGGAFTAAARAFLSQVTNARIEKPFNVQALRSLLKQRIRRDA
ncbi:MAG: response regulator [Polyangiaceae bacterium]